MWRRYTTALATPLAGLIRGRFGLGRTCLCPRISPPPGIGKSSSGGLVGTVPSHVTCPMIDPAVDGSKWLPGSEDGARAVAGVGGRGSVQPKAATASMAQIDA